MNSIVTVPRGSSAIARRQAYDAKHIDSKGERSSFAKAAGPTQAGPARNNSLLFHGGECECDRVVRRQPSALRPSGGVGFRAERLGEPGGEPLAARGPTVPSRSGYGRKRILDGPLEEHRPACRPRLAQALLAQ